MSSSNDNSICELCTETQQPTYFCIDCDTTFCAQCWLDARAHAPGKVNRDGIPHERLPNRNVVARLQDIFTPVNDSEKQRKLHKSDAGSKWFGVTYSNFDGVPVLHDYGRYSSIMRASSTASSKRWPQLVSFVGQTGAGKSTLIKVLVDYQERIKNIQNTDEFPSPVAGSINAHAPTSGDVHLYADPGTYYSPYPILYADCEGMDGGEKIPMGSQHVKGNEVSTWKSLSPPSIPVITTNETRKLQKSNKTLKRELKWATSLERCRREFVVKNLYPRILYTFSDIVVFVLRNDRTFESAALVPLLQWADTSVESSVNQSAMPHVIIVLNCSDPGINQTEWTVESATHSLLSAYANTVSENPYIKELSTFWQERGKAIKTAKDLLYCYYSSVSVIRVPQKGRYGLVDTQIAELNLQIEKRCEEARENRKRFRVSFNTEEFQQALSIGFDHFSNRLDEPLDFVQISCMSNPIPQNFGGNILRLALAMKDDPRMAGKTGRDIFNHLGLMVASCILLDYVRHQIKGTHSRLLLHYKESYSRALKLFCERFWPCTFTYRGVRCVNTQQGHARGHQDCFGKIMYHGSYESADNFTEDNFKEEWHALLESNLDDTRKRLSKMMRGEIAMEEQSAAAELHLQSVNKFYSRLSALENYTNHAACFCCLREFPEHPLPCGHVLCTTCARSFAQGKSMVAYTMGWCPLHKHQKFDEEWEITVKPELAGTRILTLDGGGIRGIVELQVLAEIQRHLGQFSIASFFDLIVGTSTGGIIALGLGVKGWSVDECSQKFEKLCSVAFTPRYTTLPGVQKVASLVFSKSKYKSEPFNELLQENFGDDRLFGGKCEERRYQRKVAVVSTYGTGEEAVILTNYNRPQQSAAPNYKFERPENGYAELKIWEACRATSAAPTYFKPYRNPRTSLTYIDGALYYNNPIRVAHQERRLLWPDMENHPPDIVLSIGTSCTSGNKTVKDTRNADTNIYRIALNRLDNILDAQNAWEQYEQEVREPDEPVHSRYTRLNPELDSKKVKLDDKDSIWQLKAKVDECLKTSKWVVETRTIARRLIASSFFFEKNVDFTDPDVIQGWICCRFPDESIELRHLGRLLRQFQSRHFSPFFMIHGEDEKNNGSLRIISKEVISAMVQESVFRIDIVEIRPAFELARIMISLCLSKDGEMFSISGFPRHFGPTNSPENGRPAKKNENGAKQGPSLASMHRNTSNSETPPIYSPSEEDIPFWARSFHKSLSSDDISRVISGTPPLNTGMNSSITSFENSRPSAPVEDMTEEEMFQFAKLESLNIDDGDSRYSAMVEGVTEDEEFEWAKRESVGPQSRNSGFSTRIESMTEEEMVELAKKESLKDRIGGI